MKQHQQRKPPRPQAATPSTAPTSAQRYRPGKRLIRWGAALTGLLLLAAPLAAEQNDLHNRSQQEPSRAQRQQRRMQPQVNPTHEHRTGIHWLQELREANPHLYEQAQHMRQQDPDAFAQWMREQLQARRREALLQKYPALREFLASLPQEQRDALETDLFRRAPPHRRTREKQHNNTPKPHRSREKRDLEQFDAQTRHFEEEIQRAEQRIEKLRELLEKRRQLRDTLPRN